jgi:hypothetical protein
MTDLDVALLDQMIAELKDREAPMTLILRPQTALQLAGLLQLAMRHPGIRGTAHETTAVLFVEHVRGFFADAPATLEVLRRGDDRREDVPWQ